MIDPLQDGISSIQLIDSMGDEKTIANSARVSLGKRIESLEEKDIKLIEYLIKHKHWSPFEHCQFTFLVKCPLYIRSQWMRHRSWNFSEISGRYVEVKPEFYIPKQFRKQSQNNRQASESGLDCVYDEHARVVNQTAFKDAHKHYLQLLAIGVCREQARGVLPQATYTEFYATCNLRSLLHFLQLRLHEGAQWEITQYSKALIELILPLYPNVIERLLECKDEPKGEQH